MDEMERDMLREGRDTRGDLGGNDTALVAEYDVPAETKRYGERGAKKESEARETGGRPWTMMAGRAEGENVEVRGVSGMTKATKATVAGFSAVTVGEKTKLTGATPMAIASEEVEIEKGASLLAVAGRKVEVEDHGYLGVAIAPRVEVEDGGKVIISLTSALLAGLTFGIGFALTALLGVSAMRRRGMMGRMRARRMMQAGMLGGVMKGAGAVRRGMQG